MKKYLKWVLPLIIIGVIISFLLPGSKAINVLPDEMTVVYEQKYLLFDVRKATYTDDTGKLRYTYVYCLEGGAGTVGTNSIYWPDVQKTYSDEYGQNNYGGSSYADKTTGEINDDGIRYIASNGFWDEENISGSDPTESDKKNYAITQLAIWLYYYDVSKDLNKYGFDSIVSRRIADVVVQIKSSGYYPSDAMKEVITEAQKLCDGAKQARIAQLECQKDSTKCQVEDASMDVNVANSKLFKNDDYIQSELITVQLTGVLNYKVSLSDNNFTIVDEQGNPKTTFASGDKIRIRISKDKVKSSINVSANFLANLTKKLTYQYYGGRYSYTNGQVFNKQRLLYAYDSVSEGLSKKLDFYYNLTEMKISKKDITNGEELPGATLTITDQNGNKIDEWVSTNTPHTISLEPGTYTLTETIAPDNYTKLQETIEFIINEDGTTDSSNIIMYNKPYDTIVISKQDITSNKEVPGATLIITNQNGNKIAEWVSTETPHTIKLQPGKYILTEIVAPEGYIKSEESVEFTIKQDGTPEQNNIVMFNRPLTTVVISKQDATTGKELSGATLKLTDANGNVIDEWVSSETPHTIKLGPGTYSLTETIAPEGYVKSEETIKFTIDNNGVASSNNIVMKNKYIEVPITALNSPYILFITYMIFGVFGISMLYLIYKKKIKL